MVIVHGYLQCELTTKTVELKKYELLFDKRKTSNQRQHYCP